VPVSRRLILFAAGLVVAVGLGVPAALGESAWEKKNEIDSRISGLENAIAKAKEREGVLSTEIGQASAQISGLSGRLDELAARLTVLERDLAAHRARLAELEAKFEDQTYRLRILRRQYTVAQARLEARLVQLYEADETTTLDVLFQAGSLTDLIEQLDYFSDIGRHDKSIADELSRLKGELSVARAETAKTKADVAKATAVIADKTAEARATRTALLAQQSALAAARDRQQGLLASVHSERNEAEEDLDAMQAASAALAAQIQAAQAAAAPPPSSSGSGTPSASGFIWPVSGVVSSGFGWRWGRMHEGIDIAAPCGTPVRAAASGRVIYAGWMDGYGNIIVIDHGNGLATAYGHQSALSASGNVSQGQTIGAVGSTGHSTGCHLHFEVRVNGSPVDPLGYL
jgi:murein DD-endopeptidase MepM/ murein hydrolase activator NlpD